MAHLNPSTGLMEDDENGPAPFQAGAIGDQAGAPVSPPMPPPPPVNLAPPPILQPPPPPVPGPPPSAMPEVQAAPPPPTPAIPPPGRVVSPAESANLAGINQNEAARAMNAAQGGQLDVAAATEKQKAADAAQAEHDAYAKQRQDIEKAHTERLNARMAQQTADEQALRDEINAKPAPESFGHKLMAAIAIGLGQYAAIRTGTSNNALKIIEGAAEEKVAARKQAIEQRRLQAERSGKMTTELRAELDDELRRVNGDHAVYLEATKAKLEKELARIGVPQAQIAANTDLQKLGADALQKREEVLKGIRDDETTLARADIAAAAKKKAAGAGGGGKGIAELVTMKEDGKKDSEIAARAAQLGIPPKTYLPSLKEVRAGSAAAAKADNDASVVRDEQGNPIGHVPTGRGGAQGFATRDADYARAAAQLEALKKDIDENGARVFMPEAVKRRQTLKKNADIAVATVSPLGKTDEAMKLESGSIGKGGDWSLMGANPEAVANKIEELKGQRERYRKETLIPLKAGAPEKSEAPARAPTPIRLEDRTKNDTAAVALARRRLRANPRDDVARRVLELNGEAP